MPEDPVDSKRVGYYFALAQVGFEMVAPIALGYWLDRRFGWSPWGAACGAVVGLVGGLFHLVWLARKAEQEEAKRKPRDQP
jgi:F0F1-type ATP synthase assembly protein I